MNKCLVAGKTTPKHCITGFEKQCMNGFHVNYAWSDGTPRPRACLEHDTRVWVTLLVMVMYLHAPPTLVCSPKHWQPLG